VGIQLFDFGEYGSDFLSVGMDEKRSLQCKSKHDLVARIMKSADLIKQECQDDLRRTTHTIAKRDKNCIEVDGGIFEHLL
jgi:hypothetical protein